eukprot:Skav216417  [mRNA]  locus=scaffold457:661440:662060:+ [translate_table: standard]
MADRKLISCIGYSLRLAKRNGRIDAAQHLWRGLYSLAKPEGECTVRPLCLFAALGLDEAKENEARHHLAQVSEISHTTAPQLRDQLTQTETQMLSVQELHAIVGRIERDLVEKLVPLLQPAESPQGSNEASVPDLVAAHGAPNPEPDSVAACEGMRAVSIGGTESAGAQGVCSSSSSFNPPGTRDEQKRQRRNLRRLELERLMGLG